MRNSEHKTELVFNFVLVLIAPGVVLKTILLLFLSSAKLCEHDILRVKLIQIIGDEQGSVSPQRLDIQSRLRKASNRALDGELGAPGRSLKLPLTKTVELPAHLSPLSGEPPRSADFFLEIQLGVVLSTFSGKSFDYELRTVSGYAWRAKLRSGST